MPLTNVRLRKCRETDLAKVLEIERRSFKYPYTYPLFLQYLLREPEGFYLADIEGKVVGYIVTSVVNERGYIVSIAVLPKMRRRGIGGELLRKGLVHLQGRVKEVELQVGVRNEGAIRFYENFCFIRKGIIPHYYPDGEDGLLMGKSMRPGSNS